MEDGSENAIIEEDEEPNELNGASKLFGPNELTTRRIGNELKLPIPPKQRRHSVFDDNTLGATRGMQMLNFL